MDKQVTIRMPKELLAKWLAALRSGEYPQTIGSLRDSNGFCCLGVLQYVRDGEVECHPDGVVRGLPTLDWLECAGVEFYGPGGQKCPSPILPATKKFADFANDNGTSFLALADEIEACAEGI